MIKKLLSYLRRNPCTECNYYVPEHNICQSKKCATCGCHPHVTLFDRLFCEAYKEN